MVVTNQFLDQSLTVRVIVTLILLAPLGLCLGMFMPLGLGVVNRLSDHPDEYVAWAWAVNGFFSVIGSVLSTILAMSFGFQTVQLVSLGIYGVAVLAFWQLTRRRRGVGARVGLTPQSRKLVNWSGRSKSSPFRAAMTSWRSSRFLPVTRSWSPWIWCDTPLRPRLLEELADLLALLGRRSRR